MSSIRSINANPLALTQNLQTATAPNALAASSGKGATATAHASTDNFSAAGAFSFAASFAFSFGGASASRSAHHCGCHPEKPSPSDSSHPEGGLKSDGNVVTTPGGYKIQSTGATSLTITGPDGKSSTISGDPHVNGSDGNKFDFKNASTFVLDDGTKIDVSTSQPSGPDGVTVATGAQITNGNDRVQISDIDKGAGKVGEVTHDGLEHAQDFAGKDVFKEAGNASHWAKDGKELIAGDKNGDYKLGQDVDTSKTDKALAALDDTLQNGDVQDAAGDNGIGQKPYGDKQGLGDAMNQIREMLSLVASLMQLFQQIQGQQGAEA